MKINELIAETKRVIGNQMQLDYFSQFYGTVIFRQDIARITREEIESLIRALMGNGIYAQLQITSREYLLRVIAEYSRVKRENRFLNLILFLTTFFTTGLTAAWLYGMDLNYSIQYSVSLMLILTAHEMGHYYYAFRHKIYATLPYFLPLPLFSPIGTLGAFIKMKSPIPNKRALFDVGIAGPIAGFIVSLIVLWIGFARLPDLEGVRSYITQIHPWSSTGEGALTVGNSILFQFFRTSLGGTHLPMYEIYHYPLIFSGWIGLFVTALNLMPIGQLDGGHISYALLGKRARYVALGAFIALAALNFYSTNWLLWTILLLFVIRLKHPPTMNDHVELDNSRQSLGWLSYLIFITCFPPAPLYFS